MPTQPTRRQFLQTAATLAALAATKTLPAQPADPKEDLLQYVDPKIATGGHGHCYPGATLPFGAVQLSPDTYNDGWDWCGGYHASDTSIMGFSHTHVSGTGAGDMLDFLVMPGTGPTKLLPGPRSNPTQGYRSAFSHADEIATPGYYSVLLSDYNIRAELTATERTGIHRYTFPASTDSHILLDLEHAFGLTNHVIEAHLANPTPTTLLGGRRMHGWAEGRHLYFALEVSKTPTRIAFFYDDEELKTFTSPTPLLSGRNLKCVLYFNTHADEQIFLKLAISAVNHENAALNLKTELPHWDFDRVHTEARAKWAAQLGKIEIATPSLDQKKTFYTALYHMSLAPTLFDDVNGQYRGLDQHIHTLPPGHHNYSTYSLWDTFRAAHPAYTLIEPTRTPDFVNTLIRMSAESPTGPPVWILQGVDTATMTGYHSASVIAEAVQKNIPGVDPHAAYAALSQRALKDSWRALDLYRAYGYIPADLEGESVSKAFEYCYDDWAVAHLAKKVAKPDIATMLLKRSTNYRNYFDKSTGFMRPKFADGTWANSSEGKGPTPFNPIDIGHFKKWRDYTESNAWQTTFGTQHDPAGLITLFGGSPQFIAKLDELFTTSSTLPADAPIDIAGLVGQYAHGNEPSHHIAYLYVYAGAPHKTQSRVRSLMDTMYAPTIDGIAGNEDCGQMSAWYILSALGFYPVDPVSTVYILGSPLFDHAKVHLAGGKTLEIEVHRPNPTDPYIQAFTLNGVPQKKAWFRHADIAQGGKLTFTMSSAPNPTFATDPTQIPPSLTL